MQRSEDAERGRQEREATARGEAIRAELLERLRQGPQTATALLPRVKAVDASLSEIAFQLDRLAGEGRALGEIGGPYRAI